MYDIVFIDDGNEGNSRIISSGYKTLKEAGEARFMNGEVVCYAGTNDVVTDDEWVWATRLAPEVDPHEWNEYALRKIASAAESEETLERAVEDFMKNAEYSMPASVRSLRGVAQRHSEVLEAMARVMKRVEARKREEAAARREKLGRSQVSASLS
jgi:hypothetical protein